MKLLQRFSIFVAALFASTVVAPAQVQTTNALAVKQIDDDCLAIQNAVMALKPIYVAYQSGNWAVVPDGDAAVAMQTNGKATFADVYKQGDNYAWINAHSVSARGTERATQLCFRQSDGSLQRVRQAATIPDLSAASAEQGFYSSNGRLIQKSKLFEENDPMIAKTVKALPFYAVLPQQ